ncbi:MAG: hypothetical protein AB7F22_28950 [Reyranella sp.]|uniref:DUF968 domain-containing protein n=1 Tax=Reyranella sp. TaxID=1929291 RepID=UPI003D095B77
MLPRKKPSKGVMRSRPDSGPLRSHAHLQWVRTSCACAVKNCEDRRIEAHHVRLGSHAGKSQKPGDDRTIPLCTVHHAESHDIGAVTFAKLHGLGDLQALASKYAAASPALARLRMRRERADG